MRDRIGKRTGAFLIRLFNWIYDVLRWLPKLRRVGIAVFPPVVLVLLLLLWFGNELYWRWAGLVLQLLGIVTVLFGIRRTRIFFDQPGLLARARLLFSQFPRFRRPPPININVNAIQGVSTASGVGVVMGLSKSLTLEARIEVLEGEQKAMQQRIDNLRTETDQKFSKVFSEIAGEKRIREEGDKLLQEKVTKTATGDWWLALTGAVWLFIGVVLSSASVELARWF